MATAPAEDERIGTAVADLARVFLGEMPDPATLDIVVHRAVPRLAPAAAGAAARGAAFSSAI